MKNTISPHSSAPLITRAASKQTYYTIRFLVDPERIKDAYRAYAYFRWVDDTLDDNSLPHGDETAERMLFLERQKSLLEVGYRGEPIRDGTLEEQMLIELIQHDGEKNSGLQSYLQNMMCVMEFDAERRGRLISQTELNEYTHWLATAVTEAMHYFIGHGSYSPQDETRYLAVTGAHVTHMLRDTCDDIRAGYYNIPREVLESNHIGPQDIQSNAYRAWVRSRVQFARKCFQSGKDYLARVEQPRCRLAGFAYTARFEWLLDTLEREKYYLRPEYAERKNPLTRLKMGLSTLAALLNWKPTETLPQPIVSQSLRKL